MESVNSLRISALQWWPLREGRDGKCEGRNEKCEFLVRESVSSSPIVRIFGKWKWKFIANFSATMTSLPSLSLSLSLSLSVSLSLPPKVPHAQYRKRFRASYNKRIRSIQIGKNFITQTFRMSNISSLPSYWWWSCTLKCLGNKVLVDLYRSNPLIVIWVALVGQKFKPFQSWECRIKSFLKNFDFEDTGRDLCFVRTVADTRPKVTKMVVTKTLKVHCHAICLFV